MPERFRRDGVIGAVTNFPDTFGIGSHAQIPALFKLRRRPVDELIPGTRNVGSTVPAFLGAMRFRSSRGLASPWR